MFTLADLGLPVERDLVGQTLSGCRVDRLLGRGGMGAVYLAHRLRDGRAVVVKVLAPELAADPLLRARFQREWVALAKVDPPHPNLVEVYDVLDLEQTPHIVMEYVEGFSLRRHLQENGRLAPEKAARAALDVARGLAVLHGLGLVHRDVKPDNVLLTPAGSAKLVDFGIAKDLFRSALTAPGQVLGTAAYMSPEQWDDGPVDGRSDVFALGAMLYHLLVGRPPFEGEDVHETADLARTGSYDPPRSIVAEVPLELELVVARALMPELRYRYPSSEELARDLERVLAGHPSAVPCLVAPEGERYALIPARRLTLGRDPKCAIQLDHEGVAPRHAQLRREADGFTLRALRGAGPILVDGLPLERGQVLRDGQRLRLGTVELVFHETGRGGDREPVIARCEAREEVSDGSLRALVQVGDPRVTAHLLEQLTPTPWVEARELALLSDLFGPEVGATVSERRRARDRGGRAGLTNRLAAITGTDLGPDPARWLAWWAQVRALAPIQLSASGRARPEYWLVEGERRVQVRGPVLVGRDPRCDLQLSDPRASRLLLRVIPVHERILIRAEAPGASLEGVPLEGGAFFEPGTTLDCPGARITLGVQLPQRAQNVGSDGLSRIDPGSFEALCDLAHPAVTTALVQHLASGQVASRLAGGALFPADPQGSARFEAALNELCEARSRRARELLPTLLGPRAGDLACCQALLATASLGPQVAPLYAWQSQSNA